MLDHHIQRQILYDLAFSDGLRFSELKPGALENKAFQYHLKIVIREGFVQKTDDGLYKLTVEGQRIWRASQNNRDNLINRAYSVLLLAIRRPADGAWLLTRRKTQPLLGLTGLIAVQPRADQQTIQTAAQVCRDQTGLTGTFVVHGNGYFRIYRASELESFIHFTLLTCSDIQGVLHQNSEQAEYYWDMDPDWQAPDMLPNMRTLFEMSQAPAGVFVEKTFDI